MGNESQPAKKSEEQIKDAMKRKWDNFSKISSVENNQEKIENKEEPINNNQNKQKEQNVENKQK